MRRRHKDFNDTLSLTLKKTFSPSFVSYCFNWKSYRLYIFKCHLKVVAITNHPEGWKKYCEHLWRYFCVKENSNTIVFLNKRTNHRLLQPFTKSVKVSRAMSKRKFIQRNLEIQEFRRVWKTVEKPVQRVDGACSHAITQCCGSASPQFVRVTNLCRQQSEFGEWQQSAYHSTLALRDTTTETEHFSQTVYSPSLFADILSLTSWFG